MEKTIQLPYGTGTVVVTLPGGADVLSITEPHWEASEEDFAKELDRCFRGRHMTGGRIAVVVADKTRLCDYARYLPVLLDRIEAGGVRPADIACYIAYGTHPSQSHAESRAAYGEVFSRYRFVHHDCEADDLFEERGTTSRGTPIRLRREILATDFVVTCGAIAHHYFAGYGGGRKLLFPGLGQRDAIYANHGLFLDRPRRSLAPGCRPGRLDGNPLAEDLAEIEAVRPADVAIHGILDSRGRVCRLLVGSGEVHFRRACACHASNCERRADDGYDLVVASCGGFPKDINFIQAHKAVHHAAAFVNEGGRLILLARCPDGVGSTTFLPWFDMGWDAAFDRLGRRYQGNGGTALAMMAKTNRIRIGLVTELDAAVCRTIGVEKIDPATAAKIADQHGGRMAVIPNASLLVRCDPSAAPSGGST